MPVSADRGRERGISFEGTGPWAALLGCWLCHLQVMTHQYAVWKTRDFSVSAGTVGGMTDPALGVVVVENASFVTLLYLVLSFGTEHESEG